MPWRVARSLLTLRNEVDKRWPNRDRTSDGTIGDKAHQALGSDSDHNPFIKDASGVGVVRGMDIDAGAGVSPSEAKDTVGDIVAELARQAGKAGHPALQGGGYVIYEGKIASAKSNPPWSWRKHTGDAHESHPHISVGRAAKAYDSTKGWGVFIPAQRTDSSSPTTAATARPAFPTLKLGSKGDHVKLVQRFLWGSERAPAMPIYGTFEKKTDTAVRDYQKLRGLFVDGRVGKDTWAPIREALSI
jgi:hypothetical protein